MRSFPGFSAFLPATHDIPLLTPQAWARGRRADPPAALVVSAKDPENGPDLELHEVLEELGFTPVVDPAGSFTRLRHLVARQARQELQVHDRYCGPLFRLGRSPHSPWPRTLGSGKRVGLLFETGFTYRLGASVRLAGRTWEHQH